MYKCAITGKQSRPGDKLHKVVAISRPKTYTRWVKNEDTNQWEEVFLSSGWEVVKELSCSQEGFDLWNSWSEDDQSFFVKALKA